MRLRIALAGLLAPLLAHTANAQLVGKPTILLSPVPVASKLLNIETINNPTALINLYWTATANVGTTYEWEITYDTVATTSSPTPTLVTLDDAMDVEARNKGTLRSGIRHNFFIRPKQIIKPAALPCAPGAQDDAMQTLVVYVYPAGNRLDVNMTSSANASWVFKYDSKPPPPPINVTTVAGGKRVQVSWTPPSPDTDVDKYEVWFCPNATRTSPDGGVPDAATSTTSDAGAAGSDAGSGPDAGSAINRVYGACTGRPDPKLPCLDGDGNCVSPTCEKRTQINKTQTAFSVEGGLVNGRPVAIVVHAIDRYGNPGDFTDPVFQTPGDVTDFFQLYKTQGGKEQGGFCFIATAAYGSYAHPLVRVFREFRDRVMKSSLLGTALVWLYYHYSPRLADEVRADQTLAARTRAILVPAAGVALIFLLAPLFGVLILGIVGMRRMRMKHRRGKLSAAALIVSLLTGVGALAPSEARAVELVRQRSVNQSFGLGLLFKGGPYRPAIGGDTGGREGLDAFSRIYGSNAKPLFSLGADLEIYRGFGTAGIGATFGFMQFVGKALVGAIDSGAPLDSRARSSDTTVFNMIPLGLDAFYRFDWLADHASIPIAPYVRGGLAYHVWWSTTGIGEISRYSPTRSAADDVVARGGKLGLRGTVGVAILLNAFDSMSALRLFETMSIRGTYLFAEYQWSKVDGFGSPGFDLSDNSWNVGLYIEI